ncbi:thioesterase family protein [Leptospira noguchii str. 2007001578]|uniref:Thioesterase family protein n=1 Tax=Leptospira noguchii str. 2007001578 TaxID=1049974 RepID=A0ABP2T9M2_9LEPT|nr:thioesterase family protein [Leptospira noguchii str. 2007001578]
MATASAEIKYRKSVTKGKIKIQSEITNQKRSIVKLRSQVFDKEENLVAELFSTWVIKLT